MHRRLTELVDFVEAQRAALLDAVYAVPEERWTERPAPGRWSVSESSRTELHEAMRAADGLALSSVRVTHPRLGELDLYQWILFVGQHEARHREQIDEVVEQLAGASR
jgi:hypothetical protein